MYWEQSIQHALLSDLGLRRKNNEDSAIVHQCTDQQEWRRRGHLLVVADGMGGHAVGELASRMAIETVPHAFLKSQDGDAASALQQAVELANDAIHLRGTQNPDFLNMGTTCSALALTPRGALVAHVGDSRVYRVRRDRIDQLTFDHSLQWEMELLHGSGVLDLSQHKNVITRSLGPESTVKVDLEGPYPIFPGDVFVLCSDGLSNMVQDAEIGAIVRENSAKQAAQLLIHLANVRGGSDNSTVIIARIGDLPANVPPPPPEPEPLDDRASLGWGWLIGFWVVSMLLVAGLAAIMLGDQPIQGVFISSMASIGMIILLIGALRRRRQLRQEVTSEDTSRTILSRPHRTATSLSSKELLESLLQVDMELQRAARDDSWQVDWKQHTDDLKAAQEALKTRRYGRGVRDVGRAIDLLMSKLPRNGEAARR